MRTKVERFTPEAGAVLRATVPFAVASGRRQVSAVDLGLALIDCHHGKVADFWAATGFDRAQARNRLRIGEPVASSPTEPQFAVSQPVAPEATPSPPATPQPLAEQLLDRDVRGILESMARRYHGALPFGPEYLLLGLLDVGPRPVVAVFEELGVTLVGCEWWLSHAQGAPENGWLVPAPIGQRTGYVPPSRWVAFGISTVLLFAFLVTIVVSCL